MSVTCKQLIDLFNKIGGKFEVIHDTRTCSLYPESAHYLKKITANFTPKDNDIGYLLSEFAYSGQFKYYVNFLPESEKSKNSIFIEDRLYDYQEKNTGGFFIEFIRDKDGYRQPVEK